MILTKLEIPKRNACCTEGNHPFAPGDTCYTLVSVGAKGWERQDLCEACWEQLNRCGLPAKAKSSWRSTVPPKGHGKTLPKQKDDRALALLKEAVSAGGLLSHQEAFVLALYLARKKRLHLRQEFDQLGETIHLYESAATEELLPVKKTSLSVDEVQATQQRLADMLATDA